MIRKAKIEEVKEINSIIDDAKMLFKSQGSSQWQDLDGYPNVYTLTQDINKDQLYVKIIDDLPVAVVAITKDEEAAYKNIYEGTWLNEDKYYVVHRLAVKKEYYGRGLAKELLNFADEVAINDGIYNIKVDTMENNIVMTTLLKNQGYKICGVIHLLRKDVIDKKRIAFQKILKRQ